MNIKRYIKNWLGVDEKKIDITDINLIRKELGGITIDFDLRNYVEDNLSEEEKNELYENADAIFNNKSFETIKKYLINLQGNFTVKEALDMSQVAFGRATINGIILYFEEMERLANIHREKNIKEEYYDEHDLI